MRFIASLFALVLLAQVAAAEIIVLERGLPTDTWLSWPEASQFDEPAYINMFPEYRQKVSVQDLALVKSAGFDFVRLGIDPAIFLWNPTDTKTKKLVAGMIMAIDDARAVGLKVIVDMHSIPRASPSPGSDQYLKSDQSFDDYLKVVEAVGKAISRFPAGNVAFEPFNEPTIDCAWDLPDGAKPRWPSMLKKLHAVARRAAPELTLVLSGACWGGADGLVQLNPAALNDENIKWSFHSYEPHIFTHQGASWTDGPAPYVDGLAFPPVAKSKAATLKRSLQRLREAKIPKPRKLQLERELRAAIGDYYKGSNAVDAATRSFKIVEAWARKHKLGPDRIILGEFGAIRGDLSKPLSDAQRGGFLRMVRNAAEKRGWAWSVWSWGGPFGLNTRENTWEFSPELMQVFGMNKK